MRPAVWPSHNSGLTLRRGHGERRVESVEDVVGARARRARLVPWVTVDRPLGVFTQRQARNAERRRLFLQPAGVREDRARVAT